VRKILDAPLLEVAAVLEEQRPFREEAYNIGAYQSDVKDEGETMI
jgi:hypothetical protein